MTIYFAGSEVDDFPDRINAVMSTIAAGFVRTAYATRGGVVIAGGFDGTAGASFTASSTFFMTFRASFQTNIGTNPIVSLRSNGVHKLRLRGAGGGSNAALILEKHDGTTATTLATSTLTVTTATPYKCDLAVEYGNPGRVRVWVDQALYIDYSGDTTTGGTTSLNSFRLYAPGTSSSYTSVFSEVIVCTQDSRTLSLVTLAPNAAGTANAWTGAYTDVDDITPSDTDVISSSTANQVANFNLTGMPAGSSNLTVTAVKVCALAARGATGPSKLALGVRTNSADSFPTAVTLDTGFSSQTATYYETNPVTSLAWTTGEIDALQIALKSEA